MSSINYPNYRSSGTGDQQQVMGWWCGSMTVGAGREEAGRRKAPRGRRPRLTRSGQRVTYCDANQQLLPYRIWLGCRNWLLLDMRSVLGMWSPEQISGSVSRSETRPDRGRLPCMAVSPLSRSATIKGEASRGTGTNVRRAHSATTNPNT
jgi:hypothetical protein